MSYQIFLSPQVKRYAIISYKHGTYAAVGARPTQEKNRLSQDLRLRKLRNIRKVSKLHRMIA